jgi:hypothetical protein
LALVPTHPDRVGGLGFLSNAVYAFSVLVVAHGTMVSSQIANRIFFLQVGLPEFEGEIAVVAIFLLCLIFGPLLVFAPQLAQTKRTGLREYGTLAETYVRDFDTKWLRGARRKDEVLVGTAPPARIDGYAAERTTEPSHRHCVLAKSRLGIEQARTAT